MAQPQWFHGEIGNYLSSLQRKTRLEARIATAALITVLVVSSVLGYFIIKQEPAEDQRITSHFYLLTYVSSSEFFIIFFGLLWAWLIGGQAKLERRTSLIHNFSKENPSYNYYHSELGFFQWTMFFSKSPTDISDSFVIMHHHQLIYLGVPMKEYPKELLKVISPYLHMVLEKYNFEERTQLKFWICKVDHPNIKGKKVMLKGYGFIVRNIEDADIMIDVDFPMVTHLQDIFLALRANAQAHRTGVRA